jgi:hypothetical protein
MDFCEFLFFQKLSQLKIHTFQIMSFMGNPKQTQK